MDSLQGQQIAPAWAAVPAPGAGRVRVFVVDDHPVVRDGLTALLAQESDFEVVGTAGCASEALEGLLRARAEVALVDLGLPDLRGVELLANLRRVCPECALLVVTVHASAEDVLCALRAGARGFLSKDARGEEIVAAVRCLARGERYLSPLAAQRLAAGVDAPRLSARESQVLRLIADGQENKEIATRLGLSEGTIKTHVHRLFAKLGVARRSQAIMVALERGLIGGPRR